MTKNEISAINIGGLSKPITKLIDSIQCAIGVVYEPRKIRNIAKANAEASVIEANAKIEVSELEARALARLNHQEVVRQENIESIVEMSINELPSTVSDEKIDQEWMMNFVDNCQNISRESMQSIWAKVLAGEITNPGSFSIRTLSALKFLQRNEAELFSKLSEYAWKCGSSWVIISPRKKDSNGIGEMGIGHLELRDFITLQACGLTEVNIWNGYKVDSQIISLEYFEEKYQLEIPPQKDGLYLANVKFSVAGQELFSIINRARDNKYKQDIVAHWKEEGILIQKVP